MAAGEHDTYMWVPSLRNNEFLSGGPGLYAVIQSLSGPWEAIPHSKIIQKGTRDMEADGGSKKFCLVNVETIVDSAFIVDNIGSENNEVLYVLPKVKWADMFVINN